MDLRNDFFIFESRCQRFRLVYSLNPSEAIWKFPKEKVSSVSLYIYIYIYIKFKIWLL